MWLLFIKRTSSLELMIWESFYWSRCMFPIDYNEPESNLFGNQTILVIRDIFDSLKRTSSQESFAQESNYTDCTVLYVFNLLKRIDSSKSFVQELDLSWCRFLIYQKEPDHKSYLFRNQTTLVALYDFDWLLILNMNVKKENITVNT